MITYLFREAGCIPGVPGTFAGVRVDVAEDGTFTVHPLPQHSAFVDAEGTDAGSDPVAASESVVQATISAPSQEQAQAEQSTPSVSVEQEGIALEEQTTPPVRVSYGG